MGRCSLYHSFKLTYSVSTGAWTELRMEANTFIYVGLLSATPRWPLLCPNQTYLLGNTSSSNTYYLQTLTTGRLTKQQLLQSGPEH